ncbi:MAG: homing endonuclease associated repeat-containing protein [Candidatus Angelobacter sp.]
MNNDNPANYDVNNNGSASRTMTREEVMAAIKECAAKLGRIPTLAQLKQATGINEKIFQRQFGNYTKALRACGLEGRGPGFMLSTEELFKEWAEIVRKSGEVPSISEYALHSRHSLTPLRKRFGGWTHVPAGLLQYAIENGLEEQWGDVVEIARKHRRRGKTGGWTSKPIAPLSSNPRVLKDRPVYGAPLNGSAMGFAPVNEIGVVFLFGVMASHLKFIVMWMGTEFPDCEAFREVAPGRWQRVRIEFEFQSRNFLQHFHDPEQCDLIVCWEHNWTECPLEVLELKKAISAAGGQQSAFSPMTEAQMTPASAVNSQESAISH